VRVPKRFPRKSKTRIYNVFLCSLETGPLQGVSLTTLCITWAEAMPDLTCPECKRNKTKLSDAVTSYDGGVQTSSKNPRGSSTEPAAPPPCTSKDGRNPGPSECLPVYLIHMKTQHMQAPAPATPRRGGRRGLHVLRFRMYEAPPWGDPEGPRKPDFGSLPKTASERSPGVQIGQKHRCESCARAWAVLPGTETYKSTNQHCHKRNLEWSSAGIAPKMHSKASQTHLEGLRAPNSDPRIFPMLPQQR
jgi:hypothetical protein